MAHKPEYLRQAFLEYLETDYQETDDLTVKVDLGTEAVTAYKLMGKLWFCTDVFPSTHCDLVDMLPGSTYAQVVRTIRPELESKRGVPMTTQKPNEKTQGKRRRSKADREIIVNCFVVPVSEEEQERRLKRLKQHFKDWLLTQIQIPPDEEGRNGHTET